MEPSAPIPRFQKSVMTVSERNKYALVQKLRAINEKCSKTLNEVGARLIERERGRDIARRRQPESKRQKKRGEDEFTPAKSEKYP